jgi:ABC-type transporter Mla MlaB component
VISSASLRIGTELAFTKCVQREETVLRISMTNESEHGVRLALEGWLVGPWVDELRKESEQHLSHAKALRLDLAKVLFVDPRGVALLRELAGRQVEYMNCSTFVSQQLTEASI